MMKRGGIKKSSPLRADKFVNLKSNIMITRKKQRHRDEYGVLSDVIE